MESFAANDGHMMRMGRHNINCHTLTIPLQAQVPPANLLIIGYSGAVKIGGPYARLPKKLSFTKQRKAVLKDMLGAKRQTPFFRCANGNFC